MRKKTIVALASALVVACSVQAQTPGANVPYRFHAQQGTVARAADSRSVPKTVVPRRISGMDGVSFTGTMIYSDSWQGSTNFNIYTFDAKDNTTFTKVFDQDDAMLESNGGGVYTNGFFYTTYFEEYGGSIAGVAYTKYDMSNWKIVDDALEFSFDKSIAQLMSYSGVAHDPTTGLNFGVMYNVGDDGFTPGYTLAAIDYDKRERNDIAPVEDTLLTFAISNDGTFYGITTNGDLKTIDRFTGVTTLVGATGVKPFYKQAMVVDPNTDRLFWAAFTRDGKGAMYEVDKATGVATKQFDMPGNEEFSTLYIKRETVPDMPQPAGNLKADFPNGSLSGEFSFTLPIFATDNSALTDSVYYTVMMNGQQVGNGGDYPGERVSLPVAAAKSGSATFMVQLSYHGVKSEEALLNTYIGFDTPTAPVSPQMQDVDGKPVLSWQAPEGGVKGGYIGNADELLYRIYSIGRDPQGYQTRGSLLVDSVKGTSYTFDADNNAGNFDMRQYVVTAFNKTAEGADEYSTAIVVGNPHDLPFTESFPGGQLQNRTWWLWRNTDWAGIGIQTDASADNDGGSLGFLARAMGDQVRFCSEKIALGSDANPRLTFSYYARPGQDTQLMVEADVAPQGVNTVVKTIDFSTLSGTDGWRNDTISLADFQQQGYIILKFHYASNSTGQITYVDNIQLQNDVTSAVRGVELKPQATGRELHYGATGQRIGSASRGLHIIVAPDGSARKVMVK